MNTSKIQYETTIKAKDNESIVAILLDEIV